MLLNDITFSSAPTPPMKLSISPLSHSSATTPTDHASPGVPSLQHLQVEEMALEGHVSSLTTKREHLAGELEGLISQASHMTKSVNHMTMSVNLFLSLSIT